MEVATTVLLTYPTMLLFAAGYLLRWQDIPRYWIWCARAREHPEHPTAATGSCHLPVRTAPAACTCDCAVPASFAGMLDLPGIPCCSACPRLAGLVLSFGATSKISDGETGCHAWHPPIPSASCRLGYINWLWYGWGAIMINQYEGSDVKIFGDVGVLEYYSLNGVSKWAFLVYSSLTFVFFFVVCYLVSRPPTCAITNI